MLLVWHKRNTVNTQLRLSRLERGVEKAEAFSRVTLLHMGTLPQCTALKEGQSDYVTPVSCQRRSSLTYKDLGD